MTAEKCVWEKTKYAKLRHCFCLSSLYPSHSFLFNDIVGVDRSVRLKHLRREAERMSEKTSTGATHATKIDDSKIRYIRALLQEIGLQIEQLPEQPDVSNRREIELLGGCRMMPIV